MLIDIYNSELEIYDLVWFCWDLHKAILLTEFNFKEDKIKFIDFLRENELFIEISGLWYLLVNDYG